VAVCMYMKFMYDNVCMYMKFMYDNVHSSVIESEFLTTSEKVLKSRCHLFFNLPALNATCNIYQSICSCLGLQESQY
jgi:hypothetical protein